MYTIYSACAITVISNITQPSVYTLQEFTAVKGLKNTGCGSFHLKEKVSEKL